MDKIVDSSRTIRNRRTEEKMKELENEIKILRVNTMEILKKCSGSVGTIDSIESHEDYLNAYASVYTRLCKYIRFYSDINCELELLLIETEKEKFDKKEPPGPGSEGFKKKAPLESRNTPEDFRAVALLPNPEKVDEFQNNSEIDLYQPNNEVIEINKNKSESSSFGRDSKESNNNLSSETNNINVSQVDNDASINAPKNYNPTYSNSGNNLDGIFQCSGPAVPQNAIYSAMPFIDSGFWLRTIFPQYLNFQRPSSGVSPPGFSNPLPLPRLMESNEYGKFYMEEGNPASETIYKDCFKPMSFERRVGTFHDIILSHLVSPDEFYAQIKNVELYVIMTNLTEDIKKFAESGSVKIRNYHDKSLLFRDKKYLASIELKGGYALGRSKDQWRRLKILDWRRDAQDNFVDVFYLDSGKKERISLECVQPMDEGLMKYPSLVQKFYLPFILPRDKEWSQKDITMFEILTETADVKFHLKVEITENDPNRTDYALGVNLLVPESGIVVNQKLVEYGVALFKPEKICARNEN